MSNHRLFTPPPLLVLYSCPECLTGEQPRRRHSAAYCLPAQESSYLTFLSSGLASLYQKSRCVLHRRYITEPIPRKEHAYSRRACLEAAMAILEYQDVIHLRTLPGGVLRQHGWFLAAIATFDFLIAAMILYVLHQSETYLEDEAYSNWTENDEQRSSPPSKDDFLRILRRSHQIWVAITHDSAAAKKPADILGTMLRKIDEAGGMAGDDGDLEQQHSLSISEWQIAGRPAHGASNLSLDIGSISPEHFGLNPARNPAGYWYPNAPSGFTADGMLARQTLATDAGDIDGAPRSDLGTGMIDVEWVSKHLETSTSGSIAV